MPTHIQLQSVAKRYRQEWIFSGLDYTFERGRSYAVTGPNGSGKSTLLRLLCGHLSPTRGTLSFRSGGKTLSSDEIFSRIAYAAPYIELVEEFTLPEVLEFHRRFQPFREGIRPSDIVDRLGLVRTAQQKEIRFFSSGMKQRLKLALALFAATPVVLLDEPTTNLDRQGIDWYLELAAECLSDRLVVVASNVAEDYRFCDRFLDLPAYK